MRDKATGCLKKIAARIEGAEISAASFDPTVTPAGAERLHDLDGIRGWAALAVVVFHLYYETFGALFPGYRNPVTWSLNGGFAVFVFFVLSGEALSASVFAGGGARAVASLAVKRHSRLAIPVLASVAIVLVLQRAGLVFAADAGRIVHRPDWLAQFAAQPITIVGVLRYGLLDVFTTADVRQHLIPFLWTMNGEMLGSIFVFAVLGAWGSLRHHEGLLLGTALLLVSTVQTAFLACFCCGLLLAALRQRGLFAWTTSRAWAGGLSLLAMIAALGIVAITSTWELRAIAVAAVLFVGAAHASAPATRFFRCGVSRLLGKLSFPLYLVQFPVIISFASWLIVRVDAGGRLDQRASAWIGLASLVVTLIAAAAFEPIEVLTKRVGHRIASVFVPPRSRVTNGAR